LLADLLVYLRELRVGCGDMCWYQESSGRTARERPTLLTSLHAGTRTQFPYRNGLCKIYRAATWSLKSPKVPF